MAECMQRRDRSLNCTLSRGISLIPQHLILFMKLLMDLKISLDTNPDYVVIHIGCQHLAR
jgi:hypothetical protein